ncbi:hypothetical protein QTP88_012361 [Uroleucon formosanum]
MQRMVGRRHAANATAIDVVRCIMASKRKRLTLKEKIDILEFRTSNTNMGVRALADKFSVSKTQILNIIANKDVLYKTWAEN